MNAIGEVRRLSAAWRHLPPVRVVDTATDLPAGSPSDAAGLFHKGEIFIVADAPAEVPRVLAHETAHWGARERLGRREWPDFMRAVRAGAAAGDPDLRDARALVRGLYVDRDGSSYLSPLLEADEILAEVASRSIDPVAGRFVVASPWRAIGALHFGRFARRCLYADVPACSRQVAGLLLAIEHRLRYGGAFWGAGRRLADWYHAATMPKPWNPTDRPMSLAESEGLLASEKSRRDDWNEWKLTARVAVTALAVIAALCGIAYWVVLIFGGLGSVFR